MVGVGRLIFCVLDRVALTSLRRVFVSSRRDAVGEIAKKRAFHPCDARGRILYSLRGVVPTSKRILRALSLTPKNELRNEAIRRCPVSADRRRISYKKGRRNGIWLEKGHSKSSMIYVAVQEGGWSTSVWGTVQYCSTHHSYQGCQWRWMASPISASGHQ